MPTVTGQLTAADVMPLARISTGSVGTLMSRAYQYQAPAARPSGSSHVLLMMPWMAGGTPVIIVVCDG